MGDAHEMPPGVIAQGVTLRRLVELDRGGGVSDVEVQHVGAAVVHDVVEFQVPKDDRHGKALRANAVRISPTAPS
jgi:hypothetical protein